MEQGPEVAAPPPEIPGVEGPAVCGERSADDHFPQAFPPPNRALGWYRFVLWVMPTCVVLMTGVGAALLPGELEFRYRGFVWGFWFVFNAAATIGLGIFDAKLEHPRWRRTAERWDPVEVVRFVLAQLFIVLFMTFLIGMILIRIG